MTLSERVRSIKFAFSDKGRLEAIDSIANDVRDLEWLASKEDDDSVQYKDLYHDSLLVIADLEKEVKAKNAEIRKLNKRLIPDEKKIPQLLDDPSTKTST